ncbi:MAG TPA: hypothetical protein PKN08_07210, partial [Opitutaceae bacterium]|nr:hypothetical protein [Opitutaceae bacterium]
MPHTSLPHDKGASSRPDWVPADAGADFATYVVQGVVTEPAGTTSSAPAPRRSRLSVDDYAAGVLARDPMVLGR